MTFKKLDNPITVKEQELDTPQRNVKQNTG